MRRFALALLVVLASSTAAQAQSDIISLEEAVQTALERSTDLQRAETGDRARVLAVQGARAGRLPTVNLQVTPRQQYGLAFDQTTGQLTSQTSETMNLGLGGQISLYDGGRTRAAVRQAELERTASLASVERTRQQVALNVAQTFLQLLLDRELVEIQQGQLAAAISQRDQVNELVEGGARPAADLVAQEAVVAERELAVVEAQGAVAADRVSLIQAIGLDPLGDYTFVGPSLEELEQRGLLAVSDLALADLLSTARERRADLRANELDIQALEAAVTTARANNRPTLDLSANVGTGYSSLQTRVTQESPDIPVSLGDGTPVLVGGVPLTFPGPSERTLTPIYTQFADNRGGSLGLTLTVPIYDAARTRRQVAQAQIQADDARIQREALVRQIDAEVQQALVQAQTAQARLAASETQVTAAEAALAVEQDRYTLGAGTLYDVAQVQARLAQAEATRAQAAYTLVLRAAAVGLATGSIDPDAMANELLGE
ncbi:MAG: TolC family protein [Bacteroidota bacterium]